ncbi:tetratricopeptide repeat family protein (plasmid) [Burkholderia thailandensis 34]|nr:tetratricopeptide repeat family protein [Burkholderia thailandensis 34]
MLLERAIQVHPLDCNAWINLVIARRDAFDLAGALEAGRRAVELAPQNPRAHNNYALALKEAQRWEEAEAHSLSACRLAPDDASYRHNLSILHLVRGNYSDGWIAHESRWSGSSELRGALPLLSAPQWQGEPLAGKTLLVWGEQGMGDVLQFCRLIPLIAEKVHLEGGRIKWNTFPQLGTLLERSLGEHVDGFSVGGGIESLPSFDYHLPLISAARVLGVLETAIPAPSPYLHADPCRTALWRTRFAEERRLKVGLAWTGSPHHQRNPFRRVGWERYAECLKEIDGVAFYSLQMGANIEVEAARAVGFQIEDHSAQFATFDESAAFIGALDLVITVCTSVAHLSGALGRPTWVLLDANPHWPWLLHRSDSPWYPSVRLYRQKKFGQWEHVMRKLGNDLRQYVCRGGRANSDRRVSGMPGA